MWNETGASFAFELKPHFYQTLWFYGLVLVVIISTGFGVYRWRVRQFVKREKQLEQLVLERKAAEEELAKERNLLRTLIDNMPDRIYAKDTESRFIICNKALAIRMGMNNPDEIVGKSDFDFLPHELAAQFRADELAIMQSGQPLINHEEPMDGVSGATRWNLATKAPLRDNQDNIIGIVGLGRDITERKRAEEVLILFSHSIKSISECVSITDLNNIILFVNQAFLNTYGYPEEELIGKPIYIIRADTTIDRDIVLDDTLHGGWHGELLNRKKDGTVFPVSLSTSVVYNEKGQPIALVGIAIDITEQKQLRLELLQSQKMQSIGTLAGGIAHDFNNILGIMLGYTSLLSKQRSDDQKFTESLSAVTQTIQRGAALVRQILTFARKTDISFEPIDITELVRESLSMLKQTFSKLIIFIETYDKNIPYISADRTQIHQALLNLCVNARDAMPNGGTISIKVEKHLKEYVRAQFVSAEQDSYVSISVSDTGEGMDEATRQRIFDPFFTTKPLGKGTGMGLSVVYGVMQAHQGFVSVESKPGNGTTFHLYFPVLTFGDNMMEVQTPDKSISVGGTETILFVEDEELLRDTVCPFLEFKGYTVHTAQDGLEGIDMYSQHKQEIALVITDLGLPGISGIEEFKRLKEINSDVKVIFASGFFDPDVKSELLKAGAHGFIQKPYMIDEILQIIRKVLDESHT